MSRLKAAHLDPDWLVEPGIFPALAVYLLVFFSLYFSVFPGSFCIFFYFSIDFILYMGAI